jgi:hypothetical protein
MIVTACIGIYLARKVVNLLNNARNSIVDASSSNEKRMM